MPGDAQPPTNEQIVSLLEAVTSALADLKQRQEQMAGDVERLLRAQRR
jgi:hypothetical protein